MNMTISRRTLESIYYHLEINRRSKFHGLARLRATIFLNSSPEMLPVILEACPNLKHLTLELVHDFLVTDGTSRLLNLFPPPLISSLESVDIESPITDKATELELFIHSSPLTNFLPKFHGLTRSRATMCLNASPELLPIVLESCPNELLIHYPEVIARLSTDLKMSQSEYDSVQVLRVRSKSLKSFTLERADPGRVENSLETVVVDTPGLEYLNLINYQYTSFQIVSLSESVKFDIDVVLSNTLNILTFVSHARDMTISRRTLEELVHHFLVTEGTSRLLNLLPPSLISSLETVDIESPVTDKATELELVRYFLENSTRLEKIVLRLNQSCRKNHKPGFLKQLVEYPRCSGLCQFVILHC
ncbi:hypothetical protein Bca52824_005273 [Brassica carinata]|uniref:FBD domain-containing protein n=1 Tax=Brassica carinata TaxID=52824 RepID=A0A8X7WTB4_BRACI|nr:hypothetical protein Bca52824_005273 [Brassica carinata]